METKRNRQPQSGRGRSATPNNKNFTKKRNFGEREYDEKKEFRSKNARSDFKKNNSYDGERKPFKPKRYDDSTEFTPRLEKKTTSTENREKTFTPNRQLSTYTETRFLGEKKMRSRTKKNTDENYDPKAKYSKKKQLAHEKAFANPSKPVRLNKFIANSGLCSRREADEYIAAGVVTVNGEVVTELGRKIVPTTDKVLFHDQLVRSEKRVYLLLNKPKDCVTTTEDPHAKITVLDLVQNACTERIFPVGRLDKNTTGVLLLTNDGDLAAKLTHPKYEKKKIYHAVLNRPLETEDMQRLAAGIELEDGKIAADEIHYVEEDDKRQIGVEIHSGRNRIVRRMFEHVGYKVVRLDRVFFAGLTKKNLPRGRWRFLSDREINMLYMGAYE
jgi:23S rRNA pseudouridine2605 synthase